MSSTILFAVVDQAEPLLLVRLGHGQQYAAGDFDRSVNGCSRELAIPLFLGTLQLGSPSS
jgi:hypothetical protein